MNSSRQSAVGSRHSTDQGPRTRDQAPKKHSFIVHRSSFIVALLASGFWLLTPAALRAATHVTGTYDLGANPRVMATVNGTPEYGLVFAQRNKPVTYNNIEYGPSIVKGYLNASGQLNDGAGNLWLDLIPNAGAIPSDSYYVVTVNIQGRVHAEIWVVPDVASVAVEAVRQVQPPGAAGSPFDLANATGLLALAHGGTNQSAWTAARCVRVNNAGTQLESAPGDCGTGGGSAPIASATVSGTVKTDATESDPVVYLKSSADTLLAGKAGSVHTHSQNDVTNLTTDLAGKESAANKNQANGYAGLNASAKLAASQMQEVISVTDLTTYGATSGSGTTAIQATVTSPASNDVLTWNGSNWVNQAPSGGSNHDLLSTTHPDTTPETVTRGAIITAQGVPATWKLFQKGAKGCVIQAGTLEMVCEPIDLTDANSVLGILAPPNGGTGNAFFAVSGPATTAKTFTFPNANATMEYQANKDAASGYAGLTAGTKLNAAQGQEVWALADLTDFSGKSGSGTTGIGTTLTGLATDDVLKWSGTNWINATAAPKAIALAANGSNCSGNNFALGVDASGNAECAQPAFSNLSGSAIDGQVPDNITLSQNVVTDYVDLTAIAAPATPATGKTRVYAQTTDKNLKAKDDAGNVSVTVKPQSCGATDKVRAIAADGTVTCSTDEGGAGSGDNISVNGTAATDADFDDATPAALGNALNVKWQKDTGTPNNISAYVPYASPLTVTSGNLTVAANSITAGHVAASLDTREIVFRLGSDTGSALVDGDDEATIFRNSIAAMTITEVWCESDAGTPSINLQRDDGSPANILSSNLTCTTSGATGTIDTNEDNLAVGDKIDFVMVTAGGTAKRVTVAIKATID
jgi:hypothetical protein